MNTATYQSANYDAAQVAEQYLGMSPYGIVKLYEVNSAKRTVKETPVDLAAYPVAVQGEVKARQGKAFNQLKIA